MSNPFPGMNPYLEDPEHWGDVHHRLMTYISDALQPVLPRSYAARLNIRVYVSGRKERIPDVLIIENKAREAHAVYALAPTLIDNPPPAEPLVIFYEPIEEREAFVEIVRAEDEHVVTLIEVLSPTNKKAGEGRKQYLRKQRENIAADKNFVEIDLLRKGVPTLLVTRQSAARLPAYRYLINVRRAAKPDQLEVYPPQLQETLPRIRIPLMEPDPDVTLNIQAVLNLAYDNGAYERLLNYQKPPRTKLSASEETFVDELLRGKNLR